MALTTHGCMPPPAYGGAAVRCALRALRTRSAPRGEFLANMKKKPHIARLEGTEMQRPEDGHVREVPRVGPER